MFLKLEINNMHPLSDDQAFRRRKPTFRWNMKKANICCFYPLVLLCHCQSVQRKSLMRTKERNVSLKLFQRVFAPAAVRDSEILAVRVEFCKEFLDFTFTHLKVQYLDKLISNVHYWIEWTLCYWAELRCLLSTINVSNESSLHQSSHSTEE